MYGNFWKAIYQLLLLQTSTETADPELPEARSPPRHEYEPRLLVIDYGYFLPLHLRISFLLTSPLARRLICIY